MEDNSKSRPLLITIVGILAIISGVFSLMRSMPLREIAYTSKVGGVYKSSDKVLIDDILPNTPAEKHGVMIGDEIIKVNNQLVKTNEDVVKLVQESNSSTIELELIRKDELVVVKLADVNTSPPVIGVIMVEGEFVKMNALESTIHILRESEVKMVARKTVDGSIGIVQRINNSDPVIQIFPLGMSLFSIIVGLGLLKLKMWGLYLFITQSIVGVFWQIWYLVNSQIGNSEYFRASSAAAMKLHETMLLIQVFGIVLGLVVLFFVWKKREVFS